MARPQEKLSICCFRCLSWFDAQNAVACRICGDLKCAKCGACLCDLSIQERKVAMAFIATYQNILRKYTKKPPDLKKHQRIVSSIGAAVDDLEAPRIKSA